MSAIPEVIAATLNADATLLATLTGGAHSWDSTGRNGINAQTLPAAYDAGGYLKPIAIINERAEMPWGGGHDSAAQYNSLRTMIEIFIYGDSGEVYSTLETPMLRIMTLLNDKYLIGAGAFKYLYREDGRDENVQNAVYLLLSYQCVFGRQLA